MGDHDVVEANRASNRRAYRLKLVMHGQSLIILFSFFYHSRLHHGTWSPSIMRKILKIRQRY